MVILDSQTLSSLPEKFIFLLESIGYGEMGIIFRENEHSSLSDFEHKAPAGGCYEDPNGKMFYKICDKDGDCYTIHVEDSQAEIW